MKIKQYMASHHRLCDQELVMAESAASAKDWVAASAHFNAFRDKTGSHFAQEEAILFPEFESATGMTSGPTQMMRAEHAQMRHLFEDLSAALVSQDVRQFLGYTETLMMIMQQHNMKEEQILYPMTDRALAGKADDILARMNLS